MARVLRGREEGEGDDGDRSENCWLCCCLPSGCCLSFWGHKCCVSCHEGSKAWLQPRWTLEALVLGATLVLSVFALHDDWDLFRVGYLYPLHIVAWSLEVIHGAKCYLPENETLSGASTERSDEQNTVRTCYALLTASVGALMADLLVLGQGSRALDAHRAITEYTQLALVLALTLLSLWRLLGPNQPHLAHWTLCLDFQGLNK